MTQNPHQGQVPGKQRRSNRRSAPRCLSVLLLSVLLPLSVLLAAPGVRADVIALDDLGIQIRLPLPARRVVSLAPHATELLYAAGGAGHIVGVSRFSDYPPAARQLPQLGDANRIDLEALFALQPDLVVAWRSALSPAVTLALQRQGIAVFQSEPQTIEAIATSLERLGHLLGEDRAATAAAGAMRHQVTELRQRYRQRAPVSVFYQVWAQPLITLNGAQPASDLIRLCGGQPLFADAHLLAPTVDPEAVLAADPEVILSAGQPAEAGWIFERWRGFPQLRAVAGGHLLLLDGDRLSRAGPRLLELAPTLCEALEAVRRQRRRDGLTP